MSMLAPWRVSFEQPALDSASLL
uniref:Uncharacterized protein n=1 Tax=Anguilla anguilla TaxID=7936 RepID=A0A0E9SSE8_ANGAN